MKLRKWRCRSCGFVSFEPGETGKSEYRIDHGSPQGCDDAGKVIGTVEATDTTEQWICWVLSKGDIDLAAKKAGVRSKELTEDNYEAIARTFIKSLEWANEASADILEDAVNEVVR